MSSSKTSGITPSSILLAAETSPRIFKRSSSQTDAALILVPADRKFTTTTDKGYQSAGEIQGQTLQHSRPSNLLGMKQTYDDANEMDCGTAGCKHEWYEEISNDLKNILIKSQHSNTRPILNVRCSTHSWFTQDSLFAQTVPPLLSVESDLNTAVTAEMKMLCHSVEGNSRSHHESIFGMCFLFDGVETHPVPYRSVGVIVFLCVAGPDSSSVHEKIQVPQLHLRVYHRDEWEDHH